MPQVKSKKRKRKYAPGISVRIERDGVIIGTGIYRKRTGRLSSIYIKKRCGLQRFEVVVLLERWPRERIFVAKVRIGNISTSTVEVDDE